MKKFFIGAFMLATLGLGTVSCGGGKSEVNNDTVISPELTDSLTYAMGAFYGANCAANMGDDINIADFIKGVQLVVGHEYSPSQIAGMTYALKNIVPNFEENKAYGIELNRNIFLQQFSNYIQKTNIDPLEYNALYGNVDELFTRINAILEKREQMRNPEAAIAAAEIEVVENTEVTTADAAGDELTVDTEIVIDEPETEE